ncbi:DUF2835 domain-containing protein [Methylomonas rapida]|uniref:DUF2835 domain-containing protein n=1 Tax=Methylomonas rapida TaxID=2963939 RepID=A0ABY7GPS5_9GAMM|nr:DUF2835 domain-containing protein [Methylomonas rapida]WAR46514.1 DUF2835 domain-containing protein [Methylomonas rapida]
MPTNQLIRFRLNLGYDQYLAVYQGVAKNVTVLADDGRRILFPAGKIQRYLTKDGIQGYFEMELTAQNKFVGIRKLA